MKSRTMTAAQFVAYWCEPDEDGRSQLSYNEENLCEREAQFMSECAMFGDAGPGQGLVISELRAEMAKVRHRLDRIAVRSN